MNNRLHIYTKQELGALCSKRAGEQKLGELVQTVNSLADLQNSAAQVVLIGIKEEIGIRANLGIGGATECWEYALQAFLNVQSNQFLSGEGILVLGALEFDELLKEAENLDPKNPEDLDNLRTLCAQIDKEVTHLISTIVKAGKTPIIIGGGHNNSFGNLAGTATALNQAINALNIDPHTDYRITEGRHSGNGFRYAREQGFLNKYAVWGLHESYNSAPILEDFSKDENLAYASFDQMLHLNEEEKANRLSHILNWLNDGAIGLELDLDSITRFPVSALNPSGYSLNEVRAMIKQIKAQANPVYFHICEGSPGRAANEQEKQLLGKSIAYLVCDFVK